MNLRIQQMSNLSEVEREQIDDFVWSAEEASEPSLDDHWLVTLENESVVIGFLVPKTDEAPHVYSN
jgi:hypothetical protein